MSSRYLYSIDSRGASLKSRSPAGSRVPGRDDGGAAALAGRARRLERLERFCDVVHRGQPKPSADTRADRRRIRRAAPRRPESRPPRTAPRPPPARRAPRLDPPDSRLLGSSLIMHPGNSPTADSPTSRKPHAIRTPLVTKACRRNPLRRAPVAQRDQHAGQRDAPARFRRPR